MKTKAVFDCMIFLQSVLNGVGPAATCFSLVRREIVELVWNEEIYSEVLAVLTRPELQARFSVLTNERIESFLTELSVLAVRIKNVPPLFTFPRDPKDEKYVNTALAANASLIVSRDRDLLDLMGDNPDGVDFRERFHGLRILDPLEFLDTIRLD